VSRSEPPAPRSVLVVDDDRALCDLLADGLTPRGFSVTTTTRAAEALDLFRDAHFDVVLTDLTMPDLDGIELCARLASSRKIPVIVITAFGSLETAVRAIRAGAYDFLTKPLDVEVVALSLERAASHRALHREVERLKLAAGETRRFGDLVGASSAMLGVYELVERAAPSDAAVLVTGESGTGKEVVARSLHQRSKRSAGPFVSVNCAALPEALLESELFGHVRGAFTDAHAARPGLFAEARGGTIFLDEIADMPFALQPKLLRALQQRSVRPVGSDREVPVDVRLVTATNRDVEAAIAERRFREDLYYRINVIHLEMPALRARGGDVLLLARHFLERFSKQMDKPLDGFDSAAAESLLEYPWPGNVRELSNCVERAVVLCRGQTITLDDLPEKVRAYRPSHVVVAGDDPSELVSLEEVERRYVLRVLDAVQGNKTKAAQILGLDRKTLYRKIELYRPT
jgi:two-component system response regulator HydG